MFKAKLIDHKGYYNLRRRLLSTLRSSGVDGPDACLSEGSSDQQHIAGPHSPLAGKRVDPLALIRIYAGRQRHRSRPPVPGCFLTFPVKNQAAPPVVNRQFHDFKILPQRVKRIIHPISVRTECIRKINAGAANLRFQRESFFQNDILPLRSRLHNYPDQIN